MSTAHHGDEPSERVPGPLKEILQRLVDQGNRMAKRAYPDGRMGAHDEGALSFAVSVDEKHGTVVIGFNKPVAWMGMSPEDAMALAAKLIEKAKAISKKPLTLKLN